MYKYTLHKLLQCYEFFLFTSECDGGKVESLIEVYTCINVLLLYFKCRVVPI